MEPILEWARKWEALVVVASTILSLWLLFRARKARSHGAPPSVRLIIADARNRPRLRAGNIEGGVAYDVLLDGLVGTVGDQRVRCTFKPIPHLSPGENEDLRPQIEGLVESPEGHVFYEADTWLEVLHSVTGRFKGLPVRMRYKDATGAMYLVKVTMPSRYDLGLMGLLDIQPTCSTPIPLIRDAS